MKVSYAKEHREQAHQGETVTDDESFLAAIKAAPDDDTARLVYADYCDERDRPDDAADQRLAVALRAVRVDPYDDGPRLVYAEIAARYGRTDRAELVRLQIEIASIKPIGVITRPIFSGAYGDSPVDEQVTGHKWTRRYHELQGREAELLGRYGSGWAADVARALGCETWGNAGVTGPAAVPNVYWEWRRGFIDRVDLPLTLFAGRRCRECAGGYVPTDRDDNTCETCVGMGVLPGRAEALFRTAPVTWINLTGCAPIGIACDAGMVSNWMGGVPEPESPHQVGPDLHRLLDLPVAIVGGQMAAKYAPTDDDARKAIDAAALRWGRELAGLPPLTTKGT